MVLSLVTLAMTDIHAPSTPIYSTCGTLKPPVHLRYNVRQLQALLNQIRLAFNLLQWALPQTWLAWTHTGTGRALGTHNYCTGHTHRGATLDGNSA